MKRLKRFLIPVLSILIFNSCIEDIDLAIPKSIENTVVIHGSVIKSDPSFVSVYVGRTGEINDAGTSVPEAIEGVIVELENEDGNSIILPQEDPTEPSNYYLEIPDADPNFRICYDERYRIKVTTLEGEVYRSAFEDIIPAPQPENLEFESYVKEGTNANGGTRFDEFLKFYINTSLDRPDQIGRVRLRWDMEGIYQFRTLPQGLFSVIKTCYVPETLGGGTTEVFDGVSSTSSRLANHKIFEMPLDYKLSYGYQLTVFQRTLSDNAFEYWNRVRENTSLEGNFFEAAPGKIQGNVSNEDNEEEDVLGYFFGSDQKVLRIHISPTDVGNPEDYCRPWIDRNTRICQDCSYIVNSTLQTPEGWEGPNFD